MSDAGSDDPALRPLTGGRRLSEITNRIVAFVREHYGRGTIKAKTYALDNLIVCVLSDGFTAIERTMMEGREPDRVLDMRRDVQRLMKQRYSEIIEALTGRKVLAFLSQAHVEPDLTIEIFLMNGPLDGFGAPELTTRCSRTPGSSAFRRTRTSSQTIAWPDGLSNVAVGFVSVVAPAIEFILEASAPPASESSTRWVLASRTSTRWTSSANCVVFVSTGSYAM